MVTISRTTLLGVLALLGGLLALLALVPDATAETHYVDIENFAYDPDHLNVTRGDTVVWTNNDSVTHTVTADGGEFDSGDIASGGSWNFTFNLTEGAYDYSCEYHTNMEGTVHVYAASEETNEWFGRWDHDTSDEDEDGQDDTITIGYDPNTEADEMDITVVIRVYREDELHATISEAHTIYDEDYDWFEQEWGADENGTYDFEVSLYDDDGNQEDTFTISNVTLHARGAVVRDNTINVDVAIVDDDDDDLINDLSFWAHIEDEGVADVLIQLFVSGVLYAENTTDDEGGAWFYNLTDGDYLWDAYYNDSQLLHDGGLNHIEVALDRGAVGFLYDHDDNDDYDDFLAQVWDNETEGDPDGYVEVYDEDDTLIASGNTDDNSGYWENVFVVYDLAQGNYTFWVWMEEDGTLLQNGSVHSYGDKGKSDSDEWFEDIYIELSDSDGDGTNDTVTLIYDVDTNASEMDVEVDWYIEDSEGDWQHWDDDYFSITNGTVDYRDMSWTANKEDNYTLRVWLYDENDTLEDTALYENVHLGKGDPQGGGSNEWFTDIYLELRDGDGDGRNDTAVVHFEVDTDNTTSIDVYTNMDVYDEEGDWVDSDSDSHTVVNGTDEWRTVSFTATENGTYDLKIELRDEDWYLEDYAEFLNVTLNASSDPQGGDSNEWFTDIYLETSDSDGDGLNDTATVHFEVDTDSLTSVDVDTYLSVYDSNGDWTGRDYDSHTVVNGSVEWRSLTFTADYDDYYDLEVELYDDDNNLEDYAAFDEVWLYATNDTGGGNDTEEWFHNWDYELEDDDKDGEDETIIISYDPNTETNEMDIEVVVSIYLDGGRYAVQRQTHTIHYSEEDWFEYYFTANETGTYDFLVDLYDDQDNWEDNFSIRDIFLTAAGEGDNQPPTAAIDDISPSPAVEGANVTLAGNGSDPDGEVVEYRWESDRDGRLGNGETLTLDSLSVGTHTISLHVRDDDGAWSDPANATLRVHERPVAEIVDIDPGSVTVGETVTFTGHGSDDGSIAAYEWRFDEEVVSTAETFSRDDLSAGLYNVSFRVRDDDDAWSAPDTATLTVNEPGNVAPTASIDSITPNPAIEGDIVALAGSGSDPDPDGDVVAYLWKFNGVEVSTADAFTRGDLTPGTYSVEFLVQDNDDAWSTADTALLIVDPANEAPSAVITKLAPNPAREGETVLFMGLGLDNDDDGTIAGYEWRIDGDSVSAAPAFSKNDLTPGTYVVSFRVQDDDDAWSEWVNATLVVNAADGGGDAPVPAPGLLAAAAAVGAAATAARRRRGLD